MKCHTCPHSSSITSGAYDSKPWNEIPCSSCKMGENSFYSVPLDEENPPVPAPGFEFLDPDHQNTDTAPRKCDFLPAETLVQFIQGFLSLPSEQRDIVAWRYQGVPYKEIARRQGTSIQLAEMRHKLALRDWPVLKSLFPLKVAKRHRRLSKL